MSKSTQDYQLIAGAGDDAIAKGLVNAQWYKTPVDRKVMKELMQRTDARAIKDTVLWYFLIISAAIVVVMTWGTSWAILACLIYGGLYSGAADSRWHECGHGTAFKTRWMNDVVYQMASFQVCRRPTVWRWSHARHHTNTLVTGNDPEIAAQLPFSWRATLPNILGIRHGLHEWRMIIMNALGKIDECEKTFIPEMEHQKVITQARIWVAIYAVVITGSIWLTSYLPLVLIGLSSLYGAWLYLFFGLTQHAALPENVLDHRQNCRTIMMNPVFRFLYSNMNYHLEHHMYPMVPYHNLPKLHEKMKDDCPTPYPSTIAAYREIIPALNRQRKDTDYFIIRPIPNTNTTTINTTSGDAHVNMA